ncbi:SMP-30/gluconolactonase/LRE family protein [Falsirhodobacter sp. alg1]|uniref:SMP-30/gluconolactonase/LRE family protein n=1 Tax=Falsirhodobacter sp. alg1 TaxID=1472418 RepID=UPI0007891B61|nr:SMP-30/gluconolactonase/LRE family protein [Falsirhodobacter sp. alg1]
MTIYPPHLQIIDPRFRELVHGMSQLERIATGFTWTEGPVWFGDHGCLLFSDIPSERLMRWSEHDGVSVFRRATKFNNGNSRDLHGRLIGCRHGTRDVVRTEADGSLTVLTAEFEGKRLNSPNDLVMASDGALWFTDPTYGIISNFEGWRAVPEQATRNVYRLGPDGQMQAMIRDFIQPNGLAFSPDEKRLYVAESSKSHDLSVPPVIRMFDVEPGAVHDRGIFCTLDNGFPDGLRVDIAGNVWTSAGDGVHCFAPDGTLLGKILVPEQVANLCFGGADGHRLFITATTSVYSIFVDTVGAEHWTRRSRDPGAVCAA